MESRNIVTRNLNENYTVCCVTLHKRSDDVVLLEKNFFFRHYQCARKFSAQNFMDLLCWHTLGVVAL